MADMDIEAEVVRRCREWLHPAMQDATDAEVMAACEGTGFVAWTRLGLAASEFFSLVTEPLARILLGLVRVLR